jgi:formate hydrogenlyase subunit 6/NADH:ubiquinone oxidoreductase subunit I
VEAIASDREGNIHVCIHCGRCVGFCPHGCLVLEKEGDEGGEVSDE